VNTVKPSFLIIYACGCLSVMLLAGCADMQLARFAPPGIIKYEELAGDQPPNPLIAERIEERVEDSDSPFPVIARTPSQSPSGRPAEQRENLTTGLEDKRDRLDVAIGADWDGVAQDRTRSEGLLDKRDHLAEDLERDAKAAARERQSPPPKSGPQN